MLQESFRVCAQPIRDDVTPPPLIGGAWLLKMFCILWFPISVMHENATAFVIIFHSNWIMIPCVMVYWKLQRHEFDQTWNSELSWASGTYSPYLKLVTISTIDILSISCENSLRLMLKVSTCNWPRFVQIKAWYRQAASNCVSQHWSRCMLPYCTLMANGVKCARRLKRG